MFNVKRMILMALALMLCAVALAEGMTPAAYLGSRGLMVLDENQLASMGGEPLDTTAFDGVTFCAFSSGSDSSQATIYFIYDGMIYVALDMTAMFGSGGGNGMAMGGPFMEMRKMFDFDLYMFGEGDSAVGHVYGSSETIKAMEETTGQQIDDESKVYATKDEFLEALNSFIG